jgi:hypothetical protein
LEREIENDRAEETEEENGYLGGKIRKKERVIGRKEQRRKIGKGNRE